MLHTIAERVPFVVVTLHRGPIVVSNGFPLSPVLVSTGNVQPPALARLLPRSPRKSERQTACQRSKTCIVSALHSGPIKSTFRHRTHVRYKPRKILVSPFATRITVCSRNRYLLPSRFSRRRLTRK